MDGKDVEGMFTRYMLQKAAELQVYRQRSLYKEIIGDLETLNHSSGFQSIGPVRAAGPSMQFITSRGSKHQY